jgi:hypothetical protein
MKALIANPDVQFRALEWAFGLLILSLIVLALSLGWVGNALDGLADWYSGLFTTNIEVADVYRPPDTAYERYVPGEPFPAGRTNPDS